MVVNVTVLAEALLTEPLVFKLSLVEATVPIKVPSDLTILSPAAKEKEGLSNPFAPEAKVLPAIVALGFTLIVFVEPEV